MKTIHWIKRPLGLAVLTVSFFCLSLLIVRSHEPPQIGPIFTVLRARQAAARNCTSRGQLLLFPYAKRIARIDAAACPDDFFEAWQKYVADVQTLAAIRRANTGKAIISIGAAILTESPLPLLDAVPENPAEAEISSNAAVADWQNLKHVALRYGIRFTPPKQSRLFGTQQTSKTLVHHRPA